MLRDAISSYPAIHAVVLLAAAIAAMAPAGMSGRFPAGLLFAASVATIIVAGRDLFAYAEGAPMDGNLRLVVLVLLLPMFPPTNLILLQQLYRSTRDLVMPAAGRQGGKFRSPVLPLVAIATAYVMAVAMLARKSAF